MEKKSKVKISVVIVLYLIVGLFYVLIRMKGVELDYSFNEYSNQYKEVRIVNKELKAEKAKLLSVKKLRQMARKYNLQDPRDKQIIVIHDSSIQKKDKR